MAQYLCEYCQATFDTRSDYLRHMRTSHPPRAPSAADLERALSGIAYPATPETLAGYARDNNEEDIAGILETLKNREYRDAAEVARAFGEIRSGEDKPEYKPSLRGGEAAMQTQAISAARFAQIFKGLAFPASADDLAAHAQDRAGEKALGIIRRMPDRRYSDMSDIAKAFGEVKPDNDK